jgi:aarF domain-containing kinase
LLDFGATIEYDKEFIDNYIEVIHAASVGDEGKCLKYSVATGFLYGARF